MLTLSTPSAALAEINSIETCRAAIAADPVAAREEAAIWTRLGGGVEARLCEAATLEALGADATAARLLTALAENPNRAIDPFRRAVIFEDAARLWLAAGQPEIAEAALASAGALTTGGPSRRLLAARVAAAQGDWPRALDLVDALLAESPDSAGLLALRAAALRRTGDPAAAAAAADRAVALDPAFPDARFEAAAARAEMGETDAAATLWLDLIDDFPDSAFADLARRNLQALSAGPRAAPAPSPPRPEPSRPRPRAADAP